ncbi:hypothetical protein [Peteryoungia ipomoeae]|nr:hypothetical protein [Peteryoungia ipomoeae]
MARDVVDADFIVIGKATAPVEPTAEVPTPRLDGPFLPRALLWLSKAAALVEARLQRLPDRHFANLVAASFVVVFLAVVLHVMRMSEHPEIAARPLDLVHVNLTPQDRNGMRVLLVNAIVENRSRARLAVPQLRADLLVDGQVVASTYIAPPAGELEGGQSRGLSARLQHPGGKTPELRLSFDDTGV